MRGLTRSLVIGGILAVFGAPASALSRLMPLPDRTLEWFVADSELIVRGVVIGVTQDRVTSGNTFQAVTISVLETFKGDPPKGDFLTFTARNLDSGVVRVRDEPADEYLFFLVRSAAHAGVATAATIPPIISNRVSPPMRCWKLEPPSKFPRPSPSLRESGAALDP